METTQADKSPWYAVRTLHCKEEGVSAYFQGEGLPCFIPQLFREVAGAGGKPVRKQVPAIHNLLFVQSGDLHVLSGLCSWAFYDNNADDAVCARFASGCCGIVTFAVKENAEGGRRCFLGMFDPSARPLVPKDELTFTIPACRFKEMLNTMKQSALFQKAYSVVRKRINGEIQNR